MPVSEEEVRVEQAQFYAVVNEGALVSIHPSAEAAWEAVHAAVAELASRYPALGEEHFREDFSVSPCELELAPEAGMKRVGWAIRS